MVITTSRRMLFSLGWALIILSLIFGFTLLSRAQDATGPAGSNWRLFWIPNTEADLAGYRVYANNVSHEISLPDTSIRFLNLQQTTDFFVVAYDTAGNVSGPSSTIRIVIVTEETPAFKASWTASDLAAYTVPAGTLTNDGNRLGVWPDVVIRFQVISDSAGVYAFALNASAKHPGARLSVNGAWTSTLTSGAAVHRVKVPLVAGANAIEIISEGSAHLWGDALTISYAGPAGTEDKTPPAAPAGWGWEREE